MKIAISEVYENKAFFFRLDQRFLSVSRKGVC